MIKGEDNSSAEALQLTLEETGQKNLNITAPSNNPSKLSKNYDYG